jgi:hypothetical protein
MVNGKYRQTTCSQTHRVPRERLSVGIGRVSLRKHERQPCQQHSPLPEAADVLEYRQAVSVQGGRHAADVGHVGRPGDVQEHGASSLWTRGEGVVESARGGGGCQPRNDTWLITYSVILPTHTLGVQPMHAWQVSAARPLSPPSSANPRRRTGRLRCDCAAGRPPQTPPPPSGVPRTRPCSLRYPATW